MIFNGSYKTKEKGWDNPLPLNMGLYFLDNGSLIINKLLLFKSLIGKKKHMLFWLNRVFHWIRMTFQAVRNVRNRWAPELKQLSDNIDKLQESLAGTDDCVVDIYI